MEIESTDSTGVQRNFFFGNTNWKDKATAAVEGKNAGEAVNLNLTGQQPFEESVEHNAKFQDERSRTKDGMPDDESKIMAKEQLSLFLTTESHLNFGAIGIPNARANSGDRRLATETPSYIRQFDLNEANNSDNDF